MKGLLQFSVAKIVSEYAIFWVVGHANPLSVKFSPVGSYTGTFVVNFYLQRIEAREPLSLFKPNSSNRRFVIIRD